MTVPGAIAFVLAFFTLPFFLRVDGVLDVHYVIFGRWFP